MTATSHAITGAAIGLIIQEPVLALPLAFVSHFICDMLPHFGFHTFEERRKYAKWFHLSLKVDALLLALLFASLIYFGASWVVIIAAILAGSPDFAWAYRYIFLEKGGKKKPPKMSLLNQFHSDIQTLESIKNGYFEAAFSGLMIAIIFTSWA